MTLFISEIIANAKRLSLPRHQIGVLWSDIMDFCEVYEKAGENEENINKKLSKAIIALQNASFGKKIQVEKKSVVKAAEKPVVKKVVKASEIPIVRALKKPEPAWKMYQKRPETFDTFTFSAYSILGFYAENVAKDIMSLVIGRKGCHFKEWTNYWNAGCLMYHRKKMTLEVSFLKSDTEKFSKFQVMKNFVLGKIDWNAKKYIHVHQKVSNDVAPY